MKRKQTFRTFSEEIGSGLAQTIRTMLSEDATGSLREARMPKPKEPATANMSSEERNKAGLAHAKAKIAYWNNVIADHRKKGESVDRAVKYLKRAQSSLQIFQGHHDRLHEGYVQGVKKDVASSLQRNKTRIAKLKQEIQSARASGDRVKAMGLLNRLNKMGASEGMNEGATEHEALKDHTKNPFHKILTKHGFQHQSTTHEVNRFAKDNPKANTTEHTYTHPDHGKSEVQVTQSHGQTGVTGNKMHSYVHRHEQKNKLISPSSGDTKPGLDKNLTRHYGEK